MVIFGRNDMVWTIRGSIMPFKIPLIIIVEIREDYETLNLQWMPPLAAQHPISTAERVPEM